MTAARVNVHPVELDVPGSTLTGCWKLLDADERARAVRFRRTTIRSRWVVARAALRDIIASYTSTPASKIRFESEANGKPILAKAQNYDGLHFNLSHSHDRALVGVSCFAPIGIDLEFVKPIPDWRDVARRFFSADENRQLERVPESGQRWAFYHCWTRKEAVIKASGEGLSAKLDTFDVSLTPQAPARVLGGEHAGVAADGWRLEHLELDAGYTGALALCGCRDVDVKKHRSWRISDA